MRIFVVVALLALGSGGCTSFGDDTPFEALPDAVEHDEPEATLPSIHRRVFASQCSCHFGSEPAAGLELSLEVARANLVDQASDCNSELTLVIPGDPDNSVLVKKLAARTEMTFLPGCGDGMPAIGDPISTEDLAAIRQWVAAGAPDAE